jgi:hypothetical protein
VSVIITGDIFRPEQLADGSLIHHQRNNIKWFSEKILSKIPSAKVIGIDKSTPKTFSQWYVTDFPGYFVDDEYIDNIDINDIVIGFELPLNLIDFLERSKTRYIDVNMHPIRFVPDRLLGVSSNFITFPSLTLRQHYFDMAMERNPIHNPDIETLIIGQTSIDRSLLNKGRCLLYVTINHYSKRSIQIQQVTNHIHLNQRMVDG